MLIWVYVVWICYKVHFLVAWLNCDALKALPAKLRDNCHMGATYGIILVPWFILLIWCDVVNKCARDQWVKTVNVYLVNPRAVNCDWCLCISEIYHCSNGRYSFCSHFKAPAWQLLSVEKATYRDCSNLFCIYGCQYFFNYIFCWTPYYYTLCCNTDKTIAKTLSVGFV